MAEAMRCKSCDAILEEHEIIWIEHIIENEELIEYKQHEELCAKCRAIVTEFEYEQGSDILYPEDTFDDIVPKNNYDNE